MEQAARNVWGQPFGAAAALLRGAPGGSPAAGRKAWPHNFK